MTDPSKGNPTSHSPSAIERPCANPTCNEKFTSSLNASAQIERGFSPQLCPACNLAGLVRKRRVESGVQERVARDREEVGIAKVELRRAEEQVRREIGRGRKEGDGSRCCVIL